MTVRVATKNDEAQLMDLCRALHADNGVFSMDDGLVRDMLYRAFDRKGGLIGCIDGRNELAGAIYMTFSHLWYSRDTHLEELFNFVRPGYRGSRYGWELLEFAQDCQRKLGVPLLTGILTNKRLQAKVAMYRKKLGTPAGAFFVVGATWHNESVKPRDDFWLRHSHGRENKNYLLNAQMTTAALPVMSIVSEKNGRD